MNSVTSAYRRNGAVLIMESSDARTILARNLGTGICLIGDMVRIDVPGESIDYLVPGEPPILYLVGGLRISREEVDKITSIREIDIDNLFKEDTDA